jgi:hypothetical protein
MSLFHNVGFDPAALLTALIAILFTYRESRRNNSVVLRIERCQYESTYSPKRSNGEADRRLSLLIRNLGISLHDPSVTLNFRERRGYSRCNIVFSRANEPSEGRDEMSKGMIAEFALKTADRLGIQSGLLFELEDPTAQNVWISVYSQGYLAKRFRVGGLRDRLVSRWNSLAFRVNQLFIRRVRANERGEEAIKTPMVLPTFIALEPAMMLFVNSLRRSHENGTQKSSPSMNAV